jgi:hypothetical protein
MAPPLLRRMYEMYQEAWDGLESLLIRTPFQHVATYVVVQSKWSLVCKMRKRTANKPEERRKFGGCEYANNVPRMMNSLRLELMDESALLTLEGEKEAYFQNLSVVGGC